MLLKELRREVLIANLKLVEHKLVIFTWGNVSAIDRNKNLVVIKPSGVDYERMDYSDMVVVDLDGNIVDGKLKPSSDTPTHLVLYKNFKNIGGVVHTHSEWATSFAQAGKGIPCYGTTHADYFYGEIPCTRKMREEEVKDNYELQTGNVIVECFKDKNPDYIPGVLVNGHGPFAWGKNAMDAVHNAVIMEEVAKIAFRTIVLNNNVEKLDQYLLDKHFLRKHGPKAYYGQRKA